MADVLKGTWYFDDDKLATAGTITSSIYTWDVQFECNGRLFNRLQANVLPGYLDKEPYPMTKMEYITEADEFVLAFDNYRKLWWAQDPWVDEVYKTIRIFSSYDNVENADQLLAYLNGRAVFTPDAEDMEIPMRSAKGIRLKTYGKQCTKNVVVIPELEELTVTENGTYTSSKVGFGRVTVDVFNADGYESYFEGGKDYVSLPTITKLKAYAFAGDDVMKSFYAPNVVTIGTNAFYAATSLMNVYLPKASGSLPQSAFASCKSLESIDVPSGIKRIEIYAFKGCVSLKSVVWPDSLEKIYQQSFDGCNSLVETTFPSSLISIGYLAFQSCTSLKRVTFLGTPSSIDEKAFYNCPALKDIYVPWSEGAVANAPWGATNAVVHYNQT